MMNKPKIYYLEQRLEDITRLRKERCSYEEIIEWLEQKDQLNISKVTLLKFCKKHHISKGIVHSVNLGTQQKISSNQTTPILGIDLKSREVQLVYNEQPCIFFIQKNTDFFGRSHWPLVAVLAGEKEFSDQANIFYKNGFIPSSFLAGWCQYQDLTLPIIPFFYAQAAPFTICEIVAPRSHYTTKNQ